MTFQPVLPPILLGALAVAVALGRVAMLRRMSGASRGRVAQWRWWGITLAMLLLFIAAARPVIEPADESPSRVADREAPNVFVILDRSPDMGVRDYPDGQSRMAAARDDVNTLIDRYPGARVAVISFSARPVLEWPLSADTWSLTPLMAALEPYAAGPDDAAQTNAGAAGNMLRYQLISAVQQYPRAKTLVFYLGAGAPESELPPRDFNLPAGAVNGGAVLGYGTPAGGQLPGTDVTGSAIGEPALEGIAQQIGVPYVRRDGPASLDSVAPPDGGLAPRSAATLAGAAGRTELYWAPAILAAGLLLVELYLVLREFRRTRLVHAEVIV